MRSDASYSVPNLSERWNNLLAPIGVTLPPNVVVRADQVIR